MVCFRIAATLLILLLSISEQSAFAVVPPTVRYEIKVRLDTETKRLFGEETIIYRSGADTALSDLYLHVYPNAYRNGNSVMAREAEQIYRDFTFAQARSGELGYLDITHLTVNNTDCPFSVDDTSLRVKLPGPLAPRDSLILHTVFVTKIPTLPGRFRFDKDEYSIAQWYPKMAVYDQSGWHNDPYHLIGEFYGEFATYDVSITLPQQFYVGATGAYVRGESGNNDIPLLADGEINARKAKDGLLRKIADGSVSATKTLHFHADNVHDFAWVTSPDYVRDDTLWDGVKVSALVLYSDIETRWKNLLSYELAALRFFSERVGPYPYQTLTVAEAYNFLAGGMEYPTLEMLDPAASIPYSHALEYVTVHEVGHNWFYGAIANNELDDPWLDEGFAEYYTFQYAELSHKDGSVIALPRWASIFADIPYRWTHELDYRISLKHGYDPPVAQPAWRFRNEWEYHAGVYSKGESVLESLRTELGDSVFANAMRKYYSDFKFKHVTIADFERTVDEVSGKDLSCFFDGNCYRNSRPNLPTMPPGSIEPFIRRKLLRVGSVCLGYLPDRFETC